MPAVHRVTPQEQETILHSLSQLLASRTDVLFAYVHGSFVQGREFRDIDVAIWMAPNASRRADLELAVDLSRATGYPVDVRKVNDAPVAVLFHALRGRPLVIADERMLAALIERTARTYHDRAPLVRRAVREAFTP
jgi:predicted nucleotidyltransferase